METKTRRPLYGGERGIKNREDVLKLRLFRAAQSDFYHDFGEGVPDRDKFTAKDLVRFQEIAQSYGVSKFAAAKATFASIVGSNPFKILENTLPGRIFGHTPLRLPTAEKDEAKAITELLGPGFSFEAIKNWIRGVQASNRDAGKTEAILAPGPLQIPIPGEEGRMRTYEVKAVLMKDKSEERTLNIASRFELLTQKQGVAMIIDASGGLSMTSLINSDLEPQPLNKLDFFIIENIENDSDSATKLKTFDKAKNEAKKNKQPNVAFLKDEIDTVLYPKFQLEASNVKGDGELLFGNADLVLSRAGDEMEADFTFGPEETYHIENVSQNANVKNASLNIIASTIAAGGKFGRNGIEGLAENNKRPYLFPYIKRVGDWCQALSLLDGTRKYNVLDINHAPTGQQVDLDTLRQNNTAIGLLTLDRILLGYALTLGIDVFFTTATDLRMLIYFRNTEQALDEAALRTEITKLKKEFDEGIQNKGQDKVESILGQAIQYVEAATTETNYIERLRGALYRVSVLRTEFAPMIAKVDAIKAQVDAGVPTLQQLYTAYYEGVALLRKLKSDEIHNDTQAISFATYPAQVEERVSFRAIDTRPGSRGAIEKLKVILSKDIIKDANQTKKVFDKYTTPEKPWVQQLVRFVQFQPTKEPFTEIFKALNEVRVLFGAPQRGGGIETDFISLLQFVVTPMTKPEYNALSISFAALSSDDAAIQESNQALPLVIGTYYRDKSSLPYTVVDNYIITKEDIPIFGRINIDDETLTETARSFLAVRFLILCLDILQGELEALVLSEDDDVDVNPAETFPSSVKALNHLRIYYKVKLIQDIYNTYLSKQDFAGAFKTAKEKYVEADAMDNDTIRAVAVGADAPRNTKDYTRTFEKIKTFRSSILRGYAGIVVDDLPIAPMDGVPGAEEDEMESTTDDVEGMDDFPSTGALQAPQQPFMLGSPQVGPVGYDSAEPGKPKRRISVKEQASRNMHAKTIRRRNEGLISQRETQGNELRDKKRRRLLEPTSTFSDMAETGGSNPRKRMKTRRARKSKTRRSAA
jgi:hypothetical protein